MRELSSYPDPGGQPLVQILWERAQIEPFNAIATAIFVLAILHTFAAARFTALSHRIQHEHYARADGRPRTSSVAAEVLHFLGEVEVVFGLWAVVLLVAMVGYSGWEPATHYFNDRVNYTEPLFVVVIMALAATRPIIGFAEAALGRVANAGRGTPAAWWITILIIGPIFGSFITEPAAMTICALLLARQFYDLQPERAAEIRDARTALRQHLDWRHAHALRGAAGADGGADVGLDDVRSCSGTSAGGRCWRSSSRRWRTS